MLIDGSERRVGAARHGTAGQVFYNSPTSTLRRTTSSKELWVDYEEVKPEKSKFEGDINVWSVNGFS